MALGLPAVAAASPPLIITGQVSVTGPTTALVVGDGSPEGSDTTFHADYAHAGESWCTSGGTEGVPFETASADLGSGRGMISEIPVKLEGLIPASEYCVELVAHNEFGAAHGQQVRFTTSAQTSPPLIITGQVSVTGPTATLTTPTAPPLPSPPPSPSVSVRRLRVFGGSVRLTLLCQTVNGTGCDVLEKVTSPAYARAGKLAGAGSMAQSGDVVTVARKRFLVASGRATTLALSLNSTGRRLLAHSSVLPARLSAVLTGVSRPLEFASQAIVFTEIASRHKR